ncbi:MAG: cysteine hydrolase [Hyphomicrobiaceae bacterium]
MARRGLDPKRTALLMIDIQNDVVHPKGAYGRAGLISPAVTNLPSRLRPLVDQMRARESWIVSTHLTLVTGKNGEPFISDHLRRLRPFLAKGDFQAGTWGHRLAAELEPVDIAIEKVAYSAFYMTRLEWVLRQASIETLLVAGITTAVSVATTVRDAYLRDFTAIVLEDGCASFDDEVHRTAIADLANIAPIKSIAEAIELVG